MFKDYIPFRIVTRDRYYRLKRAKREEVIRANDTLNEMQQSQLSLKRLLEFTQILAGRHGAEFSKLAPKSCSQLGQDLFAVSQSQIKRGGFFVEFGASNGLTLSNTYLLEKELQWTGILAEPARCWQQALRENRTADIDSRCVWSESGKELTFNETNIAELSTLDQFSGADLHYAARENGKRYQVETISLMDLLKVHNAPKNIDYLSIDTEGSELDILSSFDFGAYNISIITCEHMFTDRRKPVFDLLTSKGFSRVLEDLSGFEDWYVRN